MTFRQRLGYHLVKLLQCSHKEAEFFCQKGWVMVDKKLAHSAQMLIEDEQEITFQNQIIRTGITPQIILFHKPFGYECTNNLAIAENIYECLPQEFHHYFSLGRLDKNSEGLLLLTNSGKIYRNMMQLESDLEKEYIVKTHYPISKALQQGFEHPYILGKRETLPAKFEKISDFEFKVILKEGINRQIRRICAKNKNQVAHLLRIRFGDYHLNGLKSGEYKMV